MITSYEFNKATKEIELTKREVNYQCPKATFVFEGVDNEYVYFNVVAKNNQINDMQKRNLLEKTRFEVINVSDTSFYKAELKVSYKL